MTTCSKPGWPCASRRVTSPYGWRVLNGENDYHAAIDIGGSTPGETEKIYATQHGVVTFVGTNTGAGNVIRIKHDFGNDKYTSQYIHLLDKGQVIVGQRVKKGQYIGDMGATGGNYGLHLDFAIASRPECFYDACAPPRGDEPHGTGTIDPEIYLATEFCGDGGGGVIECPQTSWVGEFREILSQEEMLNNAQRVFNYFGDSWAKESLAAICGNMMHESYLNPQMYEFGYDWGDDRGYGIMQWTPRSKYWDWAVSAGLDPENGDSQLARITYEIQENIQYYPTGGYPETFADFRENRFKKSIDYLTECFMWNYLRPNATAGSESLPKRKSNALLVNTETCYGDGSESGGGIEDKKRYYPFRQTNMRRRWR